MILPRVLPHLGTLLGQAQLVLALQARFPQVRPRAEDRTGLFAMPCPLPG